MRNLREKQDLPHIQILTGVRRCGKSTAFKLLINDLLKAGVSPKAILNVNLDAPAFIPYWAEPGRLQQIVDTAERLTRTSVEWLFLDEIQQVKDWEVFVKAAYDARPHYSVLDKTKIKQTYGIEIPWWKDSLKKCLKELL